MSLYPEDKDPNVSVDTLRDTTEKPIEISKSPCHVHGPSHTPLLDRQIQQPQIKAALECLVHALNDAADEHKCTTCVVETSSAILTEHIKAIRAAQKDSQWTKEEKKALKGEVKALFKYVKRDVRSIWKSSVIAS